MRTPVHVKHYVMFNVNTQEVWTQGMFANHTAAVNGFRAATGMPRGRQLAQGWKPKRVTITVPIEPEDL